MKALVIGSGGREHAIAWALAKSSIIEEVLCAPGNGGTALEKKCRNLSIPVKNLEEIVEAASREFAGHPGSFAVVGPENPLAEGAADMLNAAGIPAVGAGKAASVLEASKDAAKAFMQKYGVACAKSQTFTNADEALSAIEKSACPLVVKADGLAAGKGVVVAADRETAAAAVRSFMVEDALKGAGKKVVLEEYLEGEEISILAAVSVSKEKPKDAAIVPFIPARDHKRLLEGGEGPNTGGMGAIAPVPGLPDETLHLFSETILKTTLEGLKAEGLDYRGFIFFGLMLTKSGPKLLEYNVRLGDPETQAVLPLADFDFAELCLAILEGRLAEFPLKWKSQWSCAPVAVSAGYPGAYATDKPIAISGLGVEAVGAKLFVAGAECRDGVLFTSGGRVLACAGLGATLEDAQKTAYQALSCVDFDGMFYRRDIGAPNAAASKTMKGGR